MTTVLRVVSLYLLHTNIILGRAYLELLKQNNYHALSLV